jgi:hypothetical protein
LYSIMLEFIDTLVTVDVENYGNWSVIKTGSEL